MSAPDYFKLDKEILHHLASPDLHTHVDSILSHYWLYESDYMLRVAAECRRRLFTLQENQLLERAAAEAMKSEPDSAGADENLT